MADLVSGILLFLGAALLIVFSLTYLRLDKYRFHCQHLWRHLSHELAEWACQVSRLSISPLPPELAGALTEDSTPESVSEIISRISDYAGPFDPRADGWSELVEMTGLLSRSIELYNKDARQLNRSRAVLPGKVVSAVMRIPEIPLLTIELSHLFDAVQAQQP